HAPSMHVYGRRGPNGRTLNVCRDLVCSSCFRHRGVTGQPVNPDWVRAHAIPPAIHKKKSGLLPCETKCRSLRIRRVTFVARQARATATEHTNEISRST